MKSLSHADISTSGPVKVFSVRMPEAERRRVKSLAASLGLSLQEVVHQALEAWVLQNDPQVGRRRGPQAAAHKPARPNDEGKPKRRSQGAGTRSRAGDASAQSRDPGADTWAWLRGAPRLDWSQCPVVELVSTKQG